MNYSDICIPQYERTVYISKRNVYSEEFKMRMIDSTTLVASWKYEIGLNIHFP